MKKLHFNAINDQFAAVPSKHTRYRLRCLELGVCNTCGQPLEGEDKQFIRCVKCRFKLAQRKAKARGPKKGRVAKPPVKQDLSVYNQPEHSSGLSGEHDVVLDAIQEASLGGN
jgi:DNA-directed RNA polymerase subunit RPC12/RpoP